MPIYVPLAFSFNPHPATCPYCLAPTGRAVMAGNSHKYVCRHCRAVLLGEMTPGEACGACGCRDIEDQGFPPAQESFPDNQPCGECHKKFIFMDAVVLMGGVKWRCAACRSMGAYEKEDPRAVEFRKRFPDSQNSAWDVSPADCPECSNRAIEELSEENKESFEKPLDHSEGMVQNIPMTSPPDVT